MARVFTTAIRYVTTAQTIDTSMASAMRFQLRSPPMAADRPAYTPQATTAMMSVLSSGRTSARPTFGRSRSVLHRKMWFMVQMTR